MDETPERPPASFDAEPTVTDTELPAEEPPFMTSKKDKKKKKRKGLAQDESDALVESDQIPASQVETPEHTLEEVPADDLPVAEEGELADLTEQKNDESEPIPSPLTGSDPVLEPEQLHTGDSHDSEPCAIGDQQEPSSLIEGQDLGQGAPSAEPGDELPSVAKGKKDKKNKRGSVVEDMSLYNPAEFPGLQPELSGDRGVPEPTLSAPDAGVEDEWLIGSKKKDKKKKKGKKALFGVSDPTSSLEQAEAEPVVSAATPSLPLAELVEDKLPVFDVQSEAVPQDEIREEPAALDVIGDEWAPSKKSKKQKKKKKADILATSPEPGSLARDESIEPPSEVVTEAAPPAAPVGIPVIGESAELGSIEGTPFEPVEASETSKELSPLVDEPSVDEPGTLSPIQDAVLQETAPGPSESDTFASVNKKDKKKKKGKKSRAADDWDSWESAEAPAVQQGPPHVSAQLSSTCPDSAEPVHSLIEISSSEQPVVSDLALDAISSIPTKDDIVPSDLSAVAEIVPIAPEAEVVETYEEHIQDEWALPPKKKGKKKGKKDAKPIPETGTREPSRPQSPTLEASSHRDDTQYQPTEAPKANESEAAVDNLVPVLEPEATTETQDQPTPETEPSPPDASEDIAPVKEVLVDDDKRIADEAETEDWGFAISKKSKGKKDKKKDKKKRGQSSEGPAPAASRTVSPVRVADDHPLSPTEEDRKRASTIEPSVAEDQDAASAVDNDKPRENIDEWSSTPEEKGKKGKKCEPSVAEDLPQDSPPSSPPDDTPTGLQELGDLPEAELEVTNLQEGLDNEWAFTPSKNEAKKGKKRVSEAMIPTISRSASPVPDSSAVEILDLPSDLRPSSNARLAENEAADKVSTEQRFGESASEETDTVGHSLSHEDLPETAKAEAAHQASMDEDWGFSFGKKKGKKGKKKGQPSDSITEAVSRTLSPTEAARTSIPTDSLKSSPAEPSETIFKDEPPEEASTDWAFSVTKKKGKGGKKKSIVTDSLPTIDTGPLSPDAGEPRPDDLEASQPAATPSSEPAPVEADLEPGAIEEPLKQDPEDRGFPVVKKKNGKNCKQSEPNEFETPTTVMSRAASPVRSEKDGAVSDDVQIAEIAAESAPAESEPAITQKQDSESHLLLSLPAQDDSLVEQPGSMVQQLESTTDAISPFVEGKPSVPEPIAQDDEDWGFTLTKKKKGEASKAQVETDVTVVVDSAPELAPDMLESESATSHNIAPEPKPLLRDTEDWATPAKKKRKGKKDKNKTLFTAGAVTTKAPRSLSPTPDEIAPPEAEPLEATDILTSAEPPNPSQRDATGLGQVVEDRNLTISKQETATSTASRPVSPIPSEPPSAIEVSGEPHQPTLEISPNEEPVPPEADEWSFTSSKKKQKRKKKNQSTPITPTLSRPSTPVNDGPSSTPQALDESVIPEIADIPTQLPELQQDESVVAKEDEGDWGFASLGKKEQQDLATTSTLEEEIIRDSVEAPVSLEPGAGDDWGLTSAKKKGKKGKKQGTSICENPVPTTSRAITPPGGVIASDPVPGETVEVVKEDDGWAAPPSKKSKKKRDKKVILDYGATEEPVKPPVSSTEKIPPPVEPEVPNESASANAVSRDLNDVGVVVASTLTAEQIHKPWDDSHEPTPKDREIDMAPAQAISHIIHDAPCEGSPRPEKKLRVGNVDENILLSEPIISIGESSTGPKMDDEHGDDTGILDFEDDFLGDGPSSHEKDRGFGYDDPFMEDMYTKPRSLAGKKPKEESMSKSKENETTAISSTAAATAGAVASLAERFGGQVARPKKKQKKKKLVDKRKDKEPDLFDDPVLWETSDRKTLLGEEAPGDVDAFWGGGESNESEEVEQHEILDIAKGADEASYRGDVDDAESRRKTKGPMLADAAAGEVEEDIGGDVFDGAMSRYDAAELKEAKITESLDPEIIDLREEVPGVVDTSKDEIAEAQARSRVTGVDESMDMDIVKPTELEVVESPREPEILDKPRSNEMASELATAEPRDIYTTAAIDEPRKPETTRPETPELKPDTAAQPPAETPRGFLGSEGRTPRADPRLATDALPRGRVAMENTMEFVDGDAKTPSRTEEDQLTGVTETRGSGQPRNRGSVDTEKDSNITHPIMRLERPRETPAEEENNAQRGQSSMYAGPSRRFDDDLKDDFAESPVLGREESEKAGYRQLDRGADVHAERRETGPGKGKSRSFTQDVFDDSTSTVDPIYTPIRRSISRGLEPVPEESAEGFTQTSTKKDRPISRFAPVTPDANRDSGFVADSPHDQRRIHWSEEGPHRDSGVHLKDWSDTTRTISPEGSSSFSARDRPKSIEKVERQLRRSPVGYRDLHEHPLSRTPVLREPSPRQATPEPQKTRRVSSTPTPDGNKGHSKIQPPLPYGKPEAPRSHTGASVAALGGLGGLARAVTASPATGQRSVSDNAARSRLSPSAEIAPRRVASNTSLTRHRTPEPHKFRPDTPGSIRSLHSATPPLRRVDRRISGDLRSLSQRSQVGQTSQTGQSGPAEPSSNTRSLDHDQDQRSAQSTTTPVANEGRVRSKDMTDVYDGYGEGRIGSPRSPTRPHSMRRRQSMQVLELESKVKELMAENQMLLKERQNAEHTYSQKAHSLLADRDAEIDSLKRSLELLNREVSRLTEVNQGLSAANSQLANEQNGRYRDLELLHAAAARELETTRSTQGNFEQRIRDKDAEIAELRTQLESAQAKVREMQQQILESSRPTDAEFLDVQDVDYFDHRCQQLCQHVQQWVLRFSKFSDMRSCRLTSEINDEKIIDRLDNSVLDGSDVDTYLRDRVRRRDIFMSMTMNMIWEFVFTRYLFGMDREQRQKLKSLEKHLTEIGPTNAVRLWRAVTLTLLSRRESFKRQRDLDTEAVVQAILETLSVILPPPSHLEDQIQSQLRRVMAEAVDLAVMMRTQRAEYMMLPPLQPEYNADGELVETVNFNSALMNERSGDKSTTNEELQAQGAIVRVVLFPLVVRKGDDTGVGDDEIVVCPAQVLIARNNRRKSRQITPSSDFGGVPVGASAHDLQDAEYLEGGI
ncbi:hypothetical protein jhhlp_002305 [Lomentospora prolificans]|uniref:Uncharacterized protein n=1 Tax=Lomentospora prolificans TaxID=41688 RepID=A0A2N3NDQ5_9PEZI|nr:hypothetical protein jhhlp_002305 [Lomentospora prolificans]